MFNQKSSLTIDNLLVKVKPYIKKEKERMIIEKAYYYAEDIHKHQQREDGSDLINHLLAVAFLLTNIYADYATIAAALLHEIEDEDELKRQFGSEVSSLVNGFTKINRLSFTSDSDYNITYYKKILVGLCEDVRVIFIKLADRLHDMQTLWSLKETEQKMIAKETLTILAPIAHRLGLYNIKSELEDLSLKYYKNDAYQDIVKKLNNTKLEREKAIKIMKDKISNILNKNQIKHEIKGRSKSIYSIYNKLQKGRLFSDIYDILALRIYVENKQHCYLALGLIHAQFKPIPKRFKDFIAMPKENMYQSLHTTVFDVDGHCFEIQIRTYEMDQIAEHGMAAHWSYKDKKRKDVLSRKLNIFRSLIELNSNEYNSHEFKKQVEQEILDDNIYLFTPKGDVIELPIGSTPIDFAYRVHSNIGDKMVGAIVNDNIVPLDYELKDGEIVKINIDKSSKGPTREWLKIVKTAQAKNKIKNFLNKMNKDDVLKKGETLLLKELRRNKIAFNDFYNEKTIKRLLTELSLANIDELYLGIISSKISTTHLINLVTKEQVSKDKLILKKLAKYDKKPISSIKNDILIEGIDEIKISLANCCHPIKGDDIIGYITKGKGITVHRTECHNIKNLEERVIKATWNEKSDKKWPAYLVIECTKEDSFLIDMLAKMTDANLQRINVINNQDYTIYEVVVLVPDKLILTKLINDLYQIQAVHKVERVIK